MERFAILAMLEAKPGRELEVEGFLKGALAQVQAEAGTVSWYALKLGASTFAIFDTFADQHGLKAHLSGAVARALIERSDELFATAPAIGQPEILAVTSRAH